MLHKINALRYSLSLLVSFALSFYRTQTQINMLFNKSNLKTLWSLPLSFLKKKTSLKSWYQSFLSKVWSKCNLQRLVAGLSAIIAGSIKALDSLLIGGIWRQICLVLMCLKFLRLIRVVVYENSDLDFRVYGCLSTTVPSGQFVALWTLVFHFV